MRGEERRSALMDILRASVGPVSATALAEHLGVSRQIIVGDVALLRAGGENIAATPRGYICTRETCALRRTVACSHSAEQTGDELRIFVDNGCTVVDVIVEHPVSDEQLDRVAKLFNQPKLGVSESGYLSNLKLHFPNECGRHKLLDMIGDMRLAGGYLNAAVTAFKPGHTINTNTAKAVRALLAK